MAKKQKDVNYESQSNIIVSAKTHSQKQYINTITANTLTFCTGAAGTGKTYISASLALKWLIDKRYEKLYITRPAVTSGESFGFLPGELCDKYAPYLAPFDDIFINHIGESFYSYLRTHDKITAKPLAFMRGITFNNCIVLLDEAQNTTREQMQLFLTRIGENCKVIINGDIAQKDIRQDSGLFDAIETLKNVDDVGVYNFTIDDCIRSKLVKDILKAYNA